MHYGQLAVENRWTLTGIDGEHTTIVRGMLCSNNGEVLRAAAIQGLGITLLPRFIVSDAIDKGLLQIVLPAYRPSILAVEILYPIDRHLSTKIRLLVDFLRERFRQG